MAKSSPAVVGPVGPTIRPQRTEWRETADALKLEYGEKRAYHGSPRYSFAKHVYVGRAGALLLKAERQELELREMRKEALRVLIAWDGTGPPKSHDGMMQERMECLRATLGPNVEANRHGTDWRCLG